MINHYAIVAHKPPHSYGDCLRAAVASILNCADVTDVPHFMQKGDDQDGNDMLRAFLRSRGYQPYLNAYPAASHSLANLNDMMASINPGVEYLFFCKCGNDNHVVICRDGEIVHDPAPFPVPISGPHDHDGIEGGIWLIMVLVPIKYG